MTSARSSTRPSTLARHLSVALLGLAACTDGGDADPGPTPDPGDTEAPRVVSTTPTTSATGIGASTKIVITFSEAMDRQTVESAYESAKLPLDKVSMSWNTEMTVLTISPDQPMLYAEGIGTDPGSVTPISYALHIGTGAADLAGNPLASAMDLSFATRRRMSAAFGLDAALSRTTLGGAALGEQIDVIVGDASVNNLPYRGYVSFDLATLPQGALVEDAAFSARQLATEGAPYSLGPLVAYHLTFSAMANVGLVEAMSSPGAFSQDGTAESKSIDVTSQVADDVANRAARSDLSQYRLQFDSVSMNNAYDRTTFAKGTFEMNVVYVVD